MEVRKARVGELERIYRMGFDAWAEGSPEPTYLETCRTSPKYAQGSWYVLADGAQLFSSLIVHALDEHRIGIGSIATPPDLRNKGFASTLVRCVVAEIQRFHSDATLFLYSDIRPEFYEKLGFVRLPPRAQRYRTSVCMALGSDIARFSEDASRTPEYF